MNFKRILFLAILSLVQASFRGVGIEDYDSLVEPGTFTNLLDHFDASNKETFQQRFWPKDYTANGDEPVFIYLCGESTGHYIAESSFLMQLANKVNGKVVALEHRFYGESSPMPKLTLENLQYLSHDQALADIAYFIYFLKKEKNLKDNKVFVVGGSYAGALSAWAKYKYPHLIAGALSSSGVVNAVLDFYQFDEQVQWAVRNESEECETIIHNLIDEAHHSWQIDPWVLRRAHRVPYLVWKDFEFYYADIFVEAVQYGHRTLLCEKLKEIETNPRRQELLADFALQNRAAPHNYAFRYIRDENHISTHSYRQWTYQFCSSLAYFNSVGNLEKPLRFKDMDLDYWRTYCSNSFDERIYPDTVHTNALYGDVRIGETASHVIFTNAGDDPWQWAGVRDVEKNTREVYAMLMDCKNCGHCIDLATPKDTDPDIVRQTREVITKIFEDWIKE